MASHQRRIRWICIEMRDKFLLEPLRTQCYNYLKLSTDPSNVAERLFHVHCQYDRDLRELFFEYLLEHYDEIKTTEGWENVIKEEQNQEQYRRNIIDKIEWLCEHDKKEVVLEPGGKRRRLD